MNVSGGLPEETRNSEPGDPELTVISESTEMQSMENSKITAAKYMFPVQTSDQHVYTPAKEIEIHTCVRPTNLNLLESNAPVNSTLLPSSSTVPLIINKSFSNRNDQAICDIELQENPDMMMENKYVSRLFSFLQILTAVFGSFAHGGNDVR